MKKKSRIIISLIAIFVALVVIFRFPVPMLRSDKGIKSVIVMNGNNGEMFEPENMDEMLALIKQIKCKRTIHFPSGGWSYSLHIANKEKETIIVFLSNSLCCIDGTYYEIDEKDGDNIISYIESIE